MSRIPFFLVVIQTWCCWLLCLVLSYPANNATAIYLPPTKAIATVTPFPTTNASNTLPVDRVTTLDTMKDYQNSSLTVGKTGGVHVPRNDWTAENIALRVCVLFAVLIGLVGVIKLSLIVHRRCATKDELYAQVHTV